VGFILKNKFLNKYQNGHTRHTEFNLKS